MSHPIKEIITKRQSGINVGIPSFCTANSIVIEAILEYSKNFNDYILIEATSNQVNQFGGYMNMTPYDFVDYVYDIADEIGFPKDKILLGADHFGPLAWSDKSETEAMENAKELVKQAVLAGYTKIHLDTSMKLGSDDVNTKLSDEINKVKGLSLSIAPKKETNVSTKYTCKVCGKGLIRRESAKKKGMYWWGCSGYPECKQTYFDDNGKPKYEVTEKK